MPSFTVIYKQVHDMPCFTVIYNQVHDMPCFTGSIRKYNDNLVFWPSSWDPETAVLFFRIVDMAFLWREFSL